MGLARLTGLEEKWLKNASKRVEIDAAYTGRRASGYAPSAMAQI